jgi:hypothetical protein
MERKFLRDNLDRHKWLRIAFIMYLQYDRDSYLYSKHRVFHVDMPGRIYLLDVKLKDGNFFNKFLQPFRF